MTPNRILVIDDDAVIRAMLRRGLRLEGFEVDTASDGIEGVSSALANAPSAIVLDNRMPGLDGLGVLRALQESGMATPIVLLTGDDDLTLASDAKLAGAAFFLRKPVSLAALAAILNAIINKTEP